MRLELRFLAGDPRLTLALCQPVPLAGRRRTQRLLSLMTVGLDPLACPPRARLRWPPAVPACGVTRVRLLVPDGHPVAGELRRWSHATGLEAPERALQLLERGLLSEQPDLTSAAAADAGATSKVVVLPVRSAAQPERKVAQVAEQATPQEADETAAANFFDAVEALPW